MENKTVSKKEDDLIFDLMKIVTQSQMFDFYETKILVFLLSYVDDKTFTCRLKTKTIWRFTGISRSKIRYVKKRLIFLNIISFNKPEYIIDVNKIIAKLTEEEADFFCAKYVLNIDKTL